MKKHRRTDSEEQALSGKLAERAGSMRRITTDPNHKLGGRVTQASASCQVVPYLGLDNVWAAKMNSSSST
jgi:hypothetical protein